MKEIYKRVIKVGYNCKGVILPKYLYKDVEVVKMEIDEKTKKIIITPVTLEEEIKKLLKR